MSRVGKKPILIPDGVDVKIDGKKISAKGPMGELFLNLPREVRAENREGKIFIYPHVQTKKTRAIWGLSRALVFNIVEGVIKGYEKKLEIEGIGYGAVPKGSDLELKVGYINTIVVKAPRGIKFSVEKNVITVSGIDKELVGQIAAKIRKVKPAEPYKGKGIKYFGEIIKRKVGKRVATTSTGA